MGKAFKIWLKDQLQSKGLSVSGLSRASGISRATINDLMSGESELPRTSTLMALAEALGVSVDFLRSFWGYSSSMKFTYLQREIINAVEGLSVEHQRAVAQFLKSIATTSENIRYFCEVWGTVTAGGLLHEYAERETIEVPSHYFKSIKPHFALRVSGESMAGAGIHNGDVILLKQITDRAEIRNKVCVARISENGVTLKYWREQDDEVMLESANPDFSNLGPFPARQVECVGVFVSVIQLPLAREESNGN